MYDERFDYLANADVEEEQEEGENLAAEKAVVDGILFRDTIACQRNVGTICRVLLSKC